MNTLSATPASGSLTRSKRLPQSIVCVPPASIPRSASQMRLCSIGAPFRRRVYDDPGIVVQHIAAEDLAAGVATDHRQLRVLGRLLVVDRPITAAHIDLVFQVLHIPGGVAPMRRDARPSRPAEMIAGQNPVDRPGVALHHGRVVEPVADEQILTEPLGHHVQHRAGVRRQCPRPIQLGLAAVVRHDQPGLPRPRPFHDADARRALPLSVQRFQSMSVPIVSRVPSHETSLTGAFPPPSVVKHSPSCRDITPTVLRA